MSNESPRGAKTTRTKAYTADMHSDLIKSLPVHPTSGYLDTLSPQVLTEQQLSSIEGEESPKSKQVELARVFSDSDVNICVN